MMTEHREPSIRSSRSTSTAKPPGSASSATRSSTSPCCAPDGKLQQRRLDVRFYTNLTPALSGHFDCAPDPFHAGANLGTMEHGQRQKGAEPRGRVLAPERCWKSGHWPTNPGTDGALAIRRCSPASR